MQEKMVRMGLAYSIDTFKKIISGLCVKGELEAIIRLLDNMLDKGLILIISIYDDLINGYLKNVKLEVEFRIRDKISVKIIYLMWTLTKNLSMEFYTKTFNGIGGNSNQLLVVSY